MKWNNLKKNKCPRDNRLLDFNSKVAYCSCGFVIGLEKLARYCEGKTLQELEEAKPAPEIAEHWANNI